jgi:hypothetical protein
MNERIIANEKIIILFFSKKIPTKEAIAFGALSIL